MSRGWLLVLLVGCAGEDVGGAFYELLDEGIGDDLLTSVPHDDHTCTTRLYIAGDRTGETVRACFDGAVEAHGESLQCMVFPDTVGYHQYTEDAQLFWGTSTGGLWPSPTVLLSFPLRQGRYWTTGLEVQPERMHTEVVGVERIEVPAGTFDAVRVEELDTNDMTMVTDWIVEEVGVVQRVSWRDYDQEVDTWVLLSWSRGGGP